MGVAGSPPFPMPSWVNWIAQDCNGVRWGCSAEPLRNDCGWYENKAGKYIRPDECQGAYMNLNSECVQC